MYKLKPLFDRIIVKREIIDERTPGGLIIPELAKEKPMLGIVVAVGPGKFLDNGTVRPMTIKVGDKVLFGKYAGSEVKFEGEELLLLIESDVFSSLEEGAA